MSKMGRPKVASPKSNNLSVRVADEELKRLNENADSHYMTITEVLRTSIDLLLSQ